MQSSSLRKNPHLHFFKENERGKEESEKERKCTNWHLYTKKSNSLGPCFALGEKGKQISASRKRAKRCLATFPSPDYRWARFARRYFSYLTPFFLFSPSAEPGPRLEERRTWSKSPTLSCNSHITTIPPYLLVPFPNIITKVKSKFSDKRLYNLK